MSDPHETSSTENTNTELITSIGMAIGLSAYAWDLSFNLGAFGVIFLGHIIAIWLFSLSILFITQFADKTILPGNKWLGYSMLALPTLWLITRIMDDSLTTGQFSDKLLHVASTLSIAIALPYLTYLFFYFTNPSVIHLKGKLMTGLAGIVIIIGLVGYGLGSNNYLIMSCENFVVSGQDTPKNCRCAEKPGEKPTGKSNTPGSE